MIGGTTETVIYVLQLPLCGMLCNDSPSCLAWSWTDDNACVLCQLTEPSSWSTKELPVASDNVEIQFIDVKLMNISGIV